MDNDSVISGSRFLASTLHEIRTPLQTIVSTTELLQDTPLNKEQREYEALTAEIETLAKERQDILKSFGNEGSQVIHIEVAGFVDHMDLLLSIRHSGIHTSEEGFDQAFSAVMTQ